MEIKIIVSQENYQFYLRQGQRQKEGTSEGRHPGPAVYTVEPRTPAV